MSRTVRRTWKVDGVLTDVTTAKLSDPTGIYGVKRDSNDDVEVADGTAMTHVSTGVYEYSFDEPVSNETYTAYVEFVYDGSTYHIEHDIPAAAGDEGLACTYTTLRTAVADFLAWGRNSEGTGADWSSDQAYRLDDILNSGYRQFLSPPIIEGENTAHRWSFLRPTATFDTVASTYLYDMPSDFGAIIGDIVYDDDENISRIIRQISPGMIDRRRARNNAEGRPAWFAMRPKSTVQTAVQTTECMLDPTPDAAYGLIYHYDARGQGLSDSNLYPLGGIDCYDL